MNLVCLTQYFYPEVPATAQLATDLALGLTDSGIDVTVFTGQPAYWDDSKLASKETYRGIRIHRSYSRRLSREGARSRLTNGATVGAATMLKLIARQRPDVVLVDSTSPFLLMVAWMYRKLRGVPYVFLVQDVYPEIAVELGVVGPQSIPARVWRSAYRRIYAGASRIVVLGPRMRDVVRKSLKPGEWDRVEVVPNWADGDAIRPLPPEQNPMRRELGLDDKLVVLYSGNMGLVHDMETVIDAVERLQHLPDLRFLFIGGGGKREWVESQVRERRLDNVILLPYQPLEKLPLSLTCGDASLVTLRKGMEGLSVPSKIYASMAAGLALLGVAGDDSEITNIVNEYDCGFRVPQGDVDGLVRAIERLHDDRPLLDDMKRKARAAFDATYTRQRSISEYVRVLTAAAHESP